LATVDLAGEIEGMEGHQSQTSSDRGSVGL